MNKWISVTGKPIPFDCDVYIYYQTGRLETTCFRAMTGSIQTRRRFPMSVALACAWGVVSDLSLYDKCLEKPSFMCWPDQVLVPYSAITHWMLATPLPKPPEEDKNAQKTLFSNVQDV